MSAASMALLPIVLPVVPYQKPANQIGYRLSQRDPGCGAARFGLKGQSYKALRSGAIQGAWIVEETVSLRLNSSSMFAWGKLMAVHRGGLPAGLTIWA